MKRTKISIRSLLLVAMTAGLLITGTGKSEAQLNYSLFVEVNNVEGDDIVLNDNNREDNPFNTFRAKLFINSWVSDKIGVFVKTLYDNGASTSYGDKFRVDGAYFLFHIHPLMSLKTGIIPNSIGAFGDRNYLESNPLIGSPLLYHYRTSLTFSSVSDVTDILQKRGSMSGSNIVYDACWDEGLEFSSDYNSVEYKFAITRGSYANPRAKSNNGYQYSGRFGLRPATGLRVGVSYARAPYLLGDAGGVPQGKSVEDYTASITGADFEYTRGYLELYSEWIREQFSYGENSGGYYKKENNLTVNAYFVEGKYKITPRIFAAARYGELLFSEIEDPATGAGTPWDYNISRLEAGVGYKYTRSMVIKGVIQHNKYKNAPLNPVFIYAVQLKAEL
ncbi:hypothetical protein ACFL6L_00360 [candidate division KSB1 bacterium]